jgi:hypothetical protein
VALLELVSPWDSQPQEAAGIDWGSSTGQGLIVATSSEIAPAVFDHVAQAFATPSPTFPPLAILTEQGIALKTGIRSGVHTYVSAVARYKAAPFSLLIDYIPSTTAGGQFGLWTFGDSPADGSPRLYVAQANTDLRIFVNGGYQINPSGVFTAGRRYIIILSHDGTTLSCYVNGRLLGTYTGPLGTANAANWYLGSGFGGAAEGAFANHYQWSRGLTGSEIASLSTNPWQLFQRREWVPFGAGVGGGAQTLTPALFTNAGAFYAATVSQSGGAQTLTPSLYTNPNAFYPATVARGAVSLAPSLFTNSNTFYSATVSLGGSPQTLTPALFSNAQTFFSPTVGRGAVNLAPALFTNANTFYSPVVTNGVTLRPSLLTNSQTFYGASITLGPATLRPALLANSNQFFAATLTGGVVRIKQKGLRKTRYTPGRVPADAKELPRFVQNELERLTDGLESPFTHQLLGVLHAEPSRKPQDSVMVAFADGTDWNPGAGRGLYLHDPLTSTWTKL